MFLLAYGQSLLVLSSQDQKTASQDCSVSLSLDALASSDHFAFLSLNESRSKVLSAQWVTGVTDFALTTQSA